MGTEPGSARLPSVEKGGPDDGRGPPRNRMIVAVLALLGFFVSLVLFVRYVGLVGSIICGEGDCAVVQSSSYAWIGPVPVPALGMLGYACLLALALAGVQPGMRSSRVVAGLLLAGATVGFLYSGWLTYLEAAVLHAWCVWCVSSAVLMTLTFGVCLPEAGRLRGMP